MKIEIERRFLMKALPPQLKESTYKIEQYYGTDFIGDFRIRQQVSNKKTDYILTRKKNIGLGTFEEDEMDITIEMFNLRLNKCKSFIQKSRYTHPFDGLIFEIDHLHNVNLIIMEVELPAIDHPFMMPANFDHFIIKEITGDKSFSNKKLSMPY